ncbi:MAG: hypothetical protein RBS72_14535 [Sedimentisphaerales bacterium]|jgi:hypothetical protein|nr:hypothetical protein [Sedimentisphaerales bacterium]NLZ03799.1 hypothetical protein [Phycisphaerae bacterium]HNY78799.1 hypothetical protein [Sedimentisphaerales bacterium]HOC63948.1 hypothetical protein [Sedimentisphaerales bacterium]HOH62922.1 hypothetical protein [Sedimentisphaerales bacterium]
MKTIRTRTGIIVIVSFAIIAFSLSYLLSMLPGRSEWERFRAEHPEKAIQANLRQVVMAGGAYLRSHRVPEVTYEDLLRDGEFLSRPVDPVLGEDYRTIRLSSKDTKVAVVTKDGRTITYEFGTLSVGGIDLGPLVPPSMRGDAKQGNGGS